MNNTKNLYEYNIKGDTEVPIWADVLKEKGYFFDYADTYYEETHEHITEHYYIDYMAGYFANL